MLAYTSASITYVRLPPGDPGDGSFVHIAVEIRDTLNSAAEYQLDPVTVTTNEGDLNGLIHVLQQSNEWNINSNPIIQLLASKNLNMVGQILSSISRVFNDINSQSLDNATASNYICSVMSTS